MLALSWLTPASAGDLRHGAHHDPPPGGPYAVVVSGLRNPRGLDLSADGKLYVAEGGEAGDACFDVPSPEGGGPTCGAVGPLQPRRSAHRHAHGLRHRALSLGGPLFAIGPTGVAVKGNQVYGLMGANDKALPPLGSCVSGDCAAALAAAQAQLGHLLRGVPSGGYQRKQDVGALNYDWTVANKATIGAGDPAYQDGWKDNPDFQPGDANPYGLADAPGGTYMVDGGSNTLTWVPQNGAPRVVAALPQPVDVAKPNAYDAVPTCVAPSGRSVVVADLNGRVFVVDGTSLTVQAASLTSPDGAHLVAAGGCAADGKGNVYISDIFAGSLVKVSCGRWR
ncbi:MAG: ScyD/ScyE family protein [Acidimicrobiales bacterium]